MGGGQGPGAWVAFYRQIVATFRAVPGSHFQFDWNPNLGTEQIAPDKVYPGDDVVDYIGMDIYNQDWGPGASIVPSSQYRWRDLTTKPFGLNWLRTFAAQHRKPITVPEWGTCTGRMVMAAATTPILSSKWQRGSRRPIRPTTITSILTTRPMSVGFPRGNFPTPRPPTTPPSAAVRECCSSGSTVYRSSTHFSPLRLP